MASPNPRRKPNLNAGAPTPPNTTATTKSRPFYVMPENKPTPAQIVNESRTWLNLRTVYTKRPDTPRDETRCLFGTSSSRPADNRPPSAFSLSAKHFDGTGVDSRPPSGTRLTPLDSRPRITDGDVGASMERQSSAGSGIGVVGSTASLRHHRGSVGQQHVPEKLIAGKRCGSLNNLMKESNEPGVQPATKEQRKSTVGAVPSELGKPPTSPNRKVLDLKLSPIMAPDSGYLSEHRGNSGGSSSRGSSAGTTGVGGPGSRAGSSGGGSRRRGPTAPALAEGNGSCDQPQRPPPSQPTQSQAPPSAAVQFYDEHLAPIVDLLGAPTSEPNDLLDLADHLYNELDRGGMLGRNCYRRAEILKTVFRLLDRTEPRFHVSLARIILTLRVSGNNLNNVCKLVYRIAKDKCNDQLLIDYNMPQLLIRTLECVEVGQAFEALLYLACTIKFLSTNSLIVHRLACDSDAIGVLAKVQANCLAAYGTVQEAGGTKGNDQVAHILVQVTGALRNLAGVDGTRETFLHQGIVPALCQQLELFPGDKDLVLNVCRLLSKLSIHAGVCRVLADQPNFCRTSLQLLTKYCTKEDLVVRLSFVLGNLTGRIDESRLALFPDRPSLDQLLRVMNNYVTRLTSGNSSVGTSTADQQHDVLVKFVRLVANAAIAEPVGRMAAASKTCLGFLLQIIGGRRVNEAEELVLNSIAAVNNLSYYLTGDLCTDLAARQLRIAEVLHTVVLQDHMDALTGVIRVLGNLSREPHIRDWIVSHQLDRFLITLLDSGRHETVYTALGVLLNLMSDSDKRSLLRKENAIGRLLEVLYDYVGRDWQMAGLVCKTLWNYTEHLGSTEQALGGEEAAHQLIDFLSAYLDEDVASSAVMAANTGCDLDAETCSLMTEMWRTEFAPVAQDLLQRLEAHLSQFEAL